MQDIALLYSIIKLNKNKLLYIYVNLFLILVFSFIYWYYGTPENLTFNPQFADNNNISYLSALYFSCTTHSTVGYGDITPANYFEVLICMAVELIGTAVFGYMINVIGITVD